MPKIMIFDHDMFATLVVDWIFRLRNASLIVFPDNGCIALMVAEFGKKLAIVEDGTRGVECTNVLCFGRRKGNSGLEGSSPINEAAGKVDEIAVMGFGLVIMLASVRGVSIGFKTKSG